MNLISSAARPLVRTLSFLTEATLGLLGLRNMSQRGVTEEEIAASLEEGLDAGVIEEHEHQMVRNVFRLDERQIGSMMIPRAEIAWLDAEGSTGRAGGAARARLQPLPGLPRRAERSAGRGHCACAVGSAA